MKFAGDSTDATIQRTGAEVSGRFVMLAPVHTLFFAVSVARSTLGFH